MNLNSQDNRLIYSVFKITRKGKENDIFQLKEIQTVYIINERVIRLEVVVFVSLK